jgi:hypothetical protein
VIKHPVCLKSVQKGIRGIRGRDKPIEGSFFRSWQAFEEEVSYIWNNARQYNEDGSEIYLLAGKLEVQSAPSNFFFYLLTSGSHISIDDLPRPEVWLLSLRGFRSHAK